MIEWNSLRFRVSILYSVVLGLILTLVVGVMIFQVRRILYRGFDEKLKIKAVKVANMFNALYRIETGHQSLRLGLYSVPLGRREISSQTQQLLKNMWHSEAEALNLGKDYIRIYDGAGELLSQSENIPEDFVSTWGRIRPPSEDRVIYQDLKVKTKGYRWVFYPFRGPGGQTYFIFLAGGLDYIDDFLRELIAMSTATIVIVLLVTSFFGWLLAQRVLRPVNSVVDAARKISHKDLHLRIDPKDSDQEIRDLIRAFNGMIERLEKSFEHINDFSSHVAHELKTPLAIIRGELELALQHPRNAQEYRRVMKVCLEEMDRLIRLIRDLLLLARLDYQPQMFHFQRTDVIPFFQELGEQMKIIAEAKGLKAETQWPDGPVILNVDTDQLRRLFLNLMDNAVKYTGAGGTIKFSAEIENETLLVHVSDTGRGIPQDYLPRIFEKFYRVHDSVEPVAGTGLGLSIALSIAKAHQGSIDVRSETGRGSIFTVTLPFSA